MDAPSRLGVVGSLGDGARTGESCCDVMIEFAEMTDGVRRDGVVPRGDGSDHEGGREVMLEERAGEDVTLDRFEPWTLKTRSCGHTRKPDDE